MHPARLLQMGLPELSTSGDGHSLAQQQALAGLGAFGMGIGMNLGGIPGMGMMGLGLPNSTPVSMNMPGLMGFGQNQMQASRQARRLYAGNLPPDVTEDELKRFFNKAMIDGNPHGDPGESIVSVYLNLPKKFGFVEFRTPEEATAAMNLDGITFRGQMLTIRRPSDYTPPPPNAPSQSSSSSKPVVQLDVSKLGVISTQVPDGPNKVFCGGLPYNLTETEVKELLSAYGPLSAFHLVREKDSQQSKGYCFFEYHETSITDEAIKGLNGLEIRGKTLTVRRAQAKGATTTPAPTMLNINPLGFASLASTPLNMMTPPTRIIVLLSMINAEDLKNDQEYKEIKEDIEAECAKYGSVRSVTIPRPVPNSTTVQYGVGKVYVEFEEISHALKAKSELEGRQFSGRTVLADFISEQKYFMQDFS
jgi:splicing factor U2AF subunit